MTTQWHAREKSPDERARDPIGNAYFADEAISQPAQAFVRELLQNARDARANDGAVRVRLSVHEGSESLSAKAAERWFGGLWMHLGAETSGVRVPSERPESMRYIVVEDFGTHGLTGDVALTEVPAKGAAARERFFAFVRAEGYTNKESGRGGSWGVGKTVFPRASGINSIFVLTVRGESPRTALIGQSVLCHHRLNGKAYAPDVTWGSRDRAGQVVMPVSDDATLESFRSDFRITRVNEPGLTVVVPMADAEISAATLVTNAIREYFLPILRGQLVVEVAGNDVPGGLVRLDSESLERHLSWLEHQDAEDLLPLVGMAAWMRGHPERYDLTLREGSAGEWAERLNAETAKPLGQAFLRGDTLAFRVPVVVRKEGEGKQDSYFEVLMRAATTGRSCKPVFIRDGIVIPKVRDRGLRSLRVHTIVLAENSGLAEMLRDAEGPGHTEWTSGNKTARMEFKKKYINGVGLIKLVESAPHGIAELLFASQQERDTSSLADDFPAPMDEEERQNRRRRKKRREPGDDPPEPPKGARPKAFVIDERKGGFVVRRGDKAVERPGRLHIRVAYDRTRGNPFAAYQSADFKLNQSPIKCRISGATEVKRYENVLVVDVVDDGFRVELDGFDVNRDILVDTRRVVVSPENGTPLEEVKS